MKNSNVNQASEEEMDEETSAQIKVIEFLILYTVH